MLEPSFQCKVFPSPEARKSGYASTRHCNSAEETGCDCSVILAAALLPEASVWVVFRQNIMVRVTSTMVASEANFICINLQIVKGMTSGLIFSVRAFDAL